MDFSVSDAKTLFTAITDLIKKGANLEAQQKLVELREAVLELQTVNLELKTKIGDLEQQLSLRERVKYENRYYWVFPKVGEKEGPFCQLCYDNVEKLIRLQIKYDTQVDLKTGRTSSGGHRWYRCLNCGNNFDIE
jgi:rRNA maturation endonuclease Nob1